MGCEKRAAYATRRDAETIEEKPTDQGGARRVESRIENDSAAVIRGGRTSWRDPAMSRTALMAPTLRWGAAPVRGAVVNMPSP